MWGCIRTSCSSGWLLPELAPRPLSSAPLPPAPAPPAPGRAPVPDALSAPKPEFEPEPEPEPKPFVVADAFGLSDRRSALDVADVPDPGAIWLSALSSRLEEELPMNMSVHTRAIWRASPYFTR